MSFEKYGNKIINLLNKLERYLEPNTQIGGSDGIESNPFLKDSYIKILSYSIKHVSVLIHLDAKEKTNLENPQIDYTDDQNQNIKEYSVEQQLRLGCDNNGIEYNFSMVLTFNIKTIPSQTILEQKIESKIGMFGQRPKEVLQEQKQRRQKRDKAGFKLITE